VLVFSGFIFCLHAGQQGGFSDLNSSHFKRSTKSLLKFLHLRFLHTFDTHQRNSGEGFSSLNTIAGAPLQSILTPTLGLWYSFTSWLHFLHRITFASKKSLSHIFVSLRIGFTACNKKKDTAKRARLRLARANERHASDVPYRDTDLDAFFRF